jgi:predicted GNAT superfamily acetyltransferase
MGGVEAPLVNAASIAVRHCRSLAEFDACVRVQQIIWGEAIVVPAAMFVVTRETGGQILGAFEGDRLIGFTMAVLGVHSGQVFLHSHMTAVLPEFQNAGAGRRLKLFQRQDALSRGIRLVEWTFDPLELRNAHFNLNRLGAIARRYLPNFYGITDSPLHAGLPTDRLVAEWRLDSPAVEALLSGRPRAPHAGAVRVSLPADVAALRSKESAALELQRRLCGEMTAWFSKGYAAVALESAAGRSDYVVEPFTP